MNKISSDKAFAEELLQFTALKAEQSSELCPSASQEINYRQLFSNIITAMRIFQGLPVTEEGCNFLKVSQMKWKWTTNGPEVCAHSPFRKLDF